MARCARQPDHLHRINSNPTSRTISPSEPEKFQWTREEQMPVLLRPTGCRQTGPATAMEGSHFVAPSKPSPSLIVYARIEIDRHVNIRPTSGRVITAIEVLSPSNKLPALPLGLRIQTAAFPAGGINLVEIDLVRKGLGHFRFGKRTRSE